MRGTCWASRVFTTACDRTCYSLPLEAQPWKYGILHRNCFCSKLKVLSLVSAIGLTCHSATPPDTCSKDLLLTLTFLHSRAQDEIMGVWVCFSTRVSVCATAVRDRVSNWAVQELAVSSHGAASHPETTAVCHVLCLGMKSPSVCLPSKLLVSGRHLGVKEGCSLFLIYTDWAHWLYWVTGS